MRKLLWTLPLCAIVAIIVLLRTSSAPAVVTPKQASSAPLTIERVGGPSSVTAAPRPPVPASTSSAVVAHDAAAVSADSSTPTTSPKAPVSLNQLYHAFDVINASADAKTPETLVTLIDFAASDNADIRSAAVDGLIRRDDPAAVQLLRAAAKKSDTPATVIALLQTADYLELPSKTFSEIASSSKPNARPPSASHPVTSTPATP